MDSESTDFGCVFLGVLLRLLFSCSPVYAFHLALVVIPQPSHTLYAPSTVYLPLGAAEMISLGAGEGYRRSPVNYLSLFFLRRSNCEGGQDVSDEYGHAGRSSNNSVCTFSMIVHGSSFVK
jgi:hypothetical protein